MVFYNRVIYVPATIVSGDRNFKGEALGIPPLREKINSLTGNLTEQEVVMLAKEFYNKYDNCKRNDKEKWKQIRQNVFDSQFNSNNYSIYGCYRQLWRFVNKYSKN